VAVNYTVSQRVAGHFTVLLDAKTAKKLKLTSPVVKGVTVAGLSNPIQLGSALLETTKGGSSTIHITFSKTAAAKLKNAKTVSVTVRLVASNVSGQQVVVMTTGKLK
jgi:hypothetical protein